MEKDWGRGCPNGGYLHTMFTELPFPPLLLPVASKQAALLPSLQFELPPVPVEEPQRSSTLVNAATTLSRTLCYALSFPPPSAPVAMPLERALAVIFHGLSVMPQQVHVYA